MKHGQILLRRLAALAPEQRRIALDAAPEELEVDLESFKSLAGRATMGMSAHVVFTAWDGTKPATLSPTVIGQIIRGRIGFDGLLMTDDIDMKALNGPPGEIAAAAIAAGCDLILDCWAKLDEMEERAKALPEMSEKAKERLERAMATVAGAGDARPYEELAATRKKLLAYA
jgi:beta-N-acetylhexosaminidase